jgi:hypothetical protein
MCDESINNPEEGSPTIQPEIRRQVCHKYYWRLYLKKAVSEELKQHQERE